MYIRIFKINLKECEEENIENYHTFCDFFTRKLKKGVHKINLDNNSIVSSCDGRILQFGKITNESILQVKGKNTPIKELLVTPVTAVILGAVKFPAPAVTVLPSA